MIFQRGLLKDAQQLHTHLAKLGSSFALVTNSEVRSLCGEKLADELRATGLHVHLFSFPTGEIYKTRATKESLENALFEKQMGRDCCVIALGGGVVTDLAGYLAATYCRGVPLVTIPTTLLCMVDACLGGKTGVNTPYGKNLIGAIYQPQNILIDPSVLNTLPLREIRNGIVEMIKHALIADSTLFVYLEAYADALLNLEPGCIDNAIVKNCHIKQSIVEQDERETGKRRLLNLGHTVGHTLEHLSGYALSHGEAVALGLLVEGEIAIQLGSLTRAEWNRLDALLKKYGLPLEWPASLSADQLLNAMVLDKKSIGQRPRFVILAGIGSAVSYEGAYCTVVEEALIKNALERVQGALCCH